MIVKAMGAAVREEAPLAPPPSRAELLAISFRIGCLAFGGAAGQIAMMHRIYVDEKRWVAERDFLDGLNFCTLLPGPEAQQLATYIGWRLHGVGGGLVSGLLFIAPGALLILLLAQAYVFGAHIPVIAGLLLGIKAAVVAIILQAVRRLAGRGLAGPAFRLLALAAFLGMSFTVLPFPVVVMLAALAGILLAGRDPVAPTGDAGAVRPGGVLPAAALSLLAWWLPVILAALILGDEHLLVETGLFFSKLAVITFGGAYALLAYLTEEGVRRGWADARQMIDALGLAETTPGPTIRVNLFIAFLAGSKAGGAVLAWLAGLMALWTTFAPSFLWIFAGAPLLGRVTRSPVLTAALKGISAAVVGIIAAVAARFGVVLFFAAPVRVESWPFSTLMPAGALDPWALALAALALLLTFGLKWPMLRMLALLAGIGGVLGLSA
ncbi:chromate efflux transporter [Rhabdaerophilum calidifontis]|uniref:chromate efflux transporter n=1 Tax=Rhabdaerophilum calidifontis TaxID=2604328 RepID=UPI001FE832B8|nr:chromate efflux transporter [Rhabdaerophilum calidifontis]